MKFFEHIQKAGRLEASLQKLDPVDDYEMVIDTCMNAATHYFNAALHAEGVTYEAHDLNHTTRPSLRAFSASPSANLREAMKPLEFLEEIRPRVVRGTEPCERETADKCLACFEEAKRGFLKIIGNAADPPLWESR